MAAESETRLLLATLKRKRKTVVLTAVSHLLSEEDDVFEEEQLLQMTAARDLRVRMAVLATLQPLRPKIVRNPDARVVDFFEYTVPRYTDYQFREHFRMGRETFEELLTWAAPHLPAERTLPVEKKLLATIWLLGNAESYRSVADRFGMNKGGLHRIVMGVCRTLFSLREDIIKWPEGQQLETYVEDFQERCGFPGVVGAIDGTYVPIPGPSEHRDSYINRKGTPSMQVQVVSNRSLLFLDVLTGWPGSVHDARVFRNSPLKQLLEDGLMPQKYHLLGDSAYPLTPYLLVPFRDDGHLSPVQKRYNARHSSTRVDVERSIGLLKGKFRRLKFLDMYSVDDIPMVIFAACVLHNFVIIKNGVDDDHIIVDDGSCEGEADAGPDEALYQCGAQKRDIVAINLV